MYAPPQTHGKEWLFQLGNMKQIAFLLLLIPSCVFAQFEDQIKVKPNKDADTSNVMTFYDSTSTLVGRGHVISYGALAKILSPMLGCIDALWINAGDSLVIATCIQDTLYFRGSGGLSDGDKGDVTVTGGGANWQLDADVVTPTELQPTGVSAATYNYPSLVKVDADGRIEIIISGSHPVIWADTLLFIATKTDIANLSDSIFLETTTDQIPSYQDSAYRTGYTEFRGVSSGKDTKIKLLKDGVLVFDKQQFTTSADQYFIKFMPLDTVNRVSYNMGTHTEEFSGDSTIESFFTGWNMGGGGTRAIPTKSMFGIYSEYNWPDPNTGFVTDEFHVEYADPTGFDCRPLSFYMPLYNTDRWAASFAFPSIIFTTPDTLAPFFYFQYVHPDSQTYFRMRDPYLEKGVDMLMDADANAFHIAATNLTNPTVYWSNFNHMVAPALSVQSIEGDLDALVTRDATTGYLNTITWGDAVDSLQSYGINTWTNGGGYLYPSGNEQIHIPSYGAGQAGALNVQGRLDLRYPSLAYTNLAIGNGAGNASMTAAGNVIIGQDAGQANLTGDGNIYIGQNAGQNATSANNVAIGGSALKTNVSGTGQVAIGDRALTLATGGWNTAVGAQSAQNVTSATGNASFGGISLYSLQTGGNNTALGYYSGTNTQTGQRNTFLGTYSGYGNGHANNEVYDNVMLGYGAGFSMNGNNNVFIGSNAGENNAGSGSVFVGYQAGQNETGSNLLYVDNSNTTTPLIKGNFSADSVLVNGKLGFVTTAGTATSITGRNGTQFTDVPPGYGVLLSSGSIMADTASATGLGTQYDLSLKLNKSDTAAMLSHYIERGDTAAMLAHFLERGSNLSDVANANTSLNNLLPTQTGNSGKVLTTDGSNTSWAAASGYTDEQAQDAVGAMIDGTLTYVDATPLLKVADGGIGATQLASTAVTPASYTNTSLTVDADGRITSAANGTTPITVQAIGRPVSSLSNSSASDQDYSSVYTIPANYLTTDKAIRVTLNFQYITGTSTVTLQWYVKLGSTKVYSSNTVDYANGATRSLSLAFIIQGTDAAGASVAVETGVLGTIGNTTAANQTTQPVNLATNGTLNIVPGIKYSGTGGTESVVLRTYMIEYLN